MTADTASPLLEVRGLGRHYPGVVALDDLDLSANAGEVHVLWIAEIGISPVGDVRRRAETSEDRGIVDRPVRLQKRQQRCAFDGLRNVASMSYITSTHLLERVHPQTLVVNDPAWVRNSPEKIFVTEFPDLMPETLITSDPQEIAEFRRDMGDIILKPLYGNGGAGVFHLRSDDRNLSSLLEMFEQMFREPLIAQRYLPAVRSGDKRIILVEGEPVGAINRIPSETDARSNMQNRVNRIGQ